MELSTRIDEEIKAAMRARDKARLDALRAIKSALLLEQSKGSSRSVDEPAALQMLTRMLKQRRESAEIYKKQNRMDLAADEDFQAAVIEEFTPKPLSEAELQSTVDAIIAEQGAEGMKDMGRVMAAATAATVGRAEGKLVAELVKKKLAAL